ncbi:MAG: hypothetical protein K0S86_1035 [Geminicoccaceae bacterium]|nr:hypothetical protein [Geminicoccaceae bacterium]
MPDAGILLELIATFSTAIFAGAAIYINLVEHPARMECGTAAAVRQWRPSYRRATIMQASLALTAFVTSLGAWLVDRAFPVLLAGACIGLVIPFTLIVIYPTNRQLEDPALDIGSLSTASLLARWNRLHAVRSGASLIALVILLLHLAELV